MIMYHADLPMKSVSHVVCFYLKKVVFVILL